MRQAQNSSKMSISVHGYATGGPFYPHDTLGGFGQNLNGMSGVGVGDSPSKSNSKSKSPYRNHSDERPVKMPAIIEHHYQKSAIDHILQTSARDSDGSISRF